MSSKSSSNFNSGKSNNRTGISGRNKSIGEHTTVKSRAINNPVPGKGGKKNK